MSISLTSLMTGKLTCTARKLLFTFLATFALICWNTVMAQTNSNVTINTVALGGPAVGAANGTWVKSGASPNWVYTFTPNADNAQLNVTEILNCFNGTAGAISGLTITGGQTGSVVIVTNRVSGGTQPGIITLSTPITAINSSTANVFGLTFTAANNININAAISLTGVTGASAATGGAGGKGDNITLTSTAGGNIVIATSSALTTTGGAGGAGTSNAGGAGGTGGNIALSTSGSVTVNTSSAFTSSGGNGGNGNTNGGNGAAGGAIAIGITGTPIGGAISISSSLTSTGGSGGNAGNGNNSGGAGAVAGNISVVSSAAVSTVAISAIGGSSGNAKGTNGLNGAQAGTITITSGTGTTITIGGQIAANGGSGSFALAANAAGGTGGAGNLITITGPGGISIGNSSSILAIGGAGGTGVGQNGGNGGAGGQIQLISSAGSVTTGTSSIIKAIGGAGGTVTATNGTGGNGGNGNSITITGSTGISINNSDSLITYGGAGGNGNGQNGGVGGNGGTVQFISSANVTIGTSSGINSAGGNGGAPLTSNGAGGNGGTGGTITIGNGTPIGGNISTGSSLISSGGNGGTAFGGNNAGGAGKDAAAISIVATGSVSTAGITANGGSAGNTQGTTPVSGGKGANITITSGTGTIVTIGGKISSNGGKGSDVVAGNGGGTGASAAGGAGANISITGPGGISIGNSDSLTTYGGQGGSGRNSISGTGGAAGTVQLASVAGTVTIGTSSGINTSGGAGGTGNISQSNSTGGTGGAAGAVTIGTVGTPIGGDVNISSSINSTGGTGGNGGPSTSSGGAGVAGANITVIATGGVKITGSIDASGGKGGNSNGAAGAAGGTNTSVAIALYGTGGLTLPAISNNGGAGGSGSSTPATPSGGDVYLRDGAGTVTTGGANDGVSGIISGRKLIKTGTGTVNLAGANTYSDSTSIYAGTLQISAAGRIPDASNVGLYGGSLSTGSSAGYNETAATLRLAENSIINVGTGGHSLIFSASNGVAWTSGKILTITNWNGPYDGTTAGALNGKIFVGANASGLTSGQLAQIKFLRASDGLLYSAMILSTGEVVAYDPAVLYISVSGITYPGCTGNTGSVTVTAFGGTTPYQYRITAPPASVTAYQASGTFSGLSANTYTFEAKDANNLLKSIQVELYPVVATSDTGTCSGGSVQLQANTNGALSYSWSPTTGLSNPAIANPIATPLSTTTYTVTAAILDNTNLLINPGFELGNGTGFTSSYNYDIYSAANGGYVSSWNPATPANGNGVWGSGHNGIYLVTGTSTLLCTNLVSFVPRTGSFMMVVDGPNNATNIGTPAWTQTVNGLTIGNSYVFSYYVTNAFTSFDGSAPILRASINSTNLTGTVTYPNPYTVSSMAANPTANWALMSYTWVATSTSAIIELFDTRQSDGSNDFALDDMSFVGSCNATDNVTVVITTPPTLGVVSQPTQVCIGQGAVINLTGLTPVDTFTVNYTINGITQTAVTGVISDASGNATFTTPALAAANNGQIIQVNSLTNTGGHSNCTQTFTGKTATLNVSIYVTWLGSGTTDWNTATNWCGGIPTATSKVLIPDYGAGGIYPVISGGINGYSNSIIISTNASVTINNTGSLTVSGSFSNSGTLTNNGEIILNGTTAQSFPGAAGTIAAMNKLTVNNSSGLNPAVTFDRNFFISGALSPTAGIINVNNAFVTLTSNKDTTARVAAVGGTSGFTYTGTGQFIIQRYFPARRSWRLVTAPILPGAGTHTLAEAWQEQGNGASGRDYTSANWSASVSADTVTAGYGTQITGGSMANGFDQGMRNNPSVKYYTAGSWPGPLNTNSTLVDSKEGWMLFVRGDRKNFGEITDQYKTPTTTTLRPRGQLYTGVKSITAAGMTVVGNPYASAVDYTSMSRTGPGTWPVKPTYYVWDPYLGGAQGVGAFVTLTWNSTNLNFDRSAPITGTGTSGYDNRYIPSGAAVMVDFPSGGGTLQINETDKNAANTTTAFRPLPSGKQHQMRTVLNTVDADKTTYVSDGILSYFDNSFNNEADENDARKLGNFNENIVIEKGDKLLSIERRKILGEGDTIFYGLYRMQRKNYQLQFMMDNIGTASFTKAFLEDTYLKTKTPVSLKAETRVNFSVTDDAASSAKDRFRLVFRRSFVFTNINAFVHNSDIAVDWKAVDESNLGHYEIEKSADGISFTKAGIKTIAKGSAEIGYSWVDAKPSPGEYYYRIKRINSDDGTAMYSDVAKAVITKRIPSLNISPNPVTGNMIRLQMTNIPTGVYQARLYNSDGKVILNKKINHNETSNTETVKIDHAVAKAVYHIEVTGPGNYSEKQKVIIN